jgi:hypothetical protein
LVDCECEVGVLRERFSGEPSSFQYCITAYRADRARCDRDAVPDCISATVEVESAHIFQVLTLREEGAKISYPGVTGDCADAQIREWGDEMSKRRGFELCIGIHKDKNFMACHFDCALQGHGFSRVGLPHDPHPGILDEKRRRRRRCHLSNRRPR